LAALSAACTLSEAAPENITDGELSLLPKFCADVQAIRYGGESSGKESPRARQWVALLGKPFWTLHHYCWGLIHIRRSNAPGLAPNVRQGMVRDAVSDYLFVLTNAPSDFVLAPEIYLRLGEAQLILQQASMARESFQRARELKPDYWPAYTRWIDFLVKNDQKSEAKALAAEGLRHAPNIQDLVNRYRRLGGDPTTIVPVQAAKPAGAETDPQLPATEKADSKPAEVESMPRAASTPQ
jgi:tetratricopeptide (TPR) repeat protein